MPVCSPALTYLSHGQSRKEKAERTKTLGEPIELAGKALAIEVRDGVAWVAENTKVIRKLDLEVSPQRRASGALTNVHVHADGEDAAAVQGAHGARDEPRVLRPRARIGRPGAPHLWVLG